MSRSYKKTPGWTDQSGSGRSRFFKRKANKDLRKKKLDEDLLNGCHYKRFSGVCQWDICDYKFLYYTRAAVLFSVEEDIKRWGKPYYPLYRYYMK